MNILILVGSTRSDSFNARLADAASHLLPDDAQVVRWDRLEELPYYSEERDTPGAPAVVADLRAAIGAADAVVITTPEYNASIPGVLKNAVDWASRPFGASTLKGKPVAVLGATPSPGGAASAREHLVAILTRASAKPLPTTVGIPSAHRAFDGDRLVDLEASERIRELLAELDDSLEAAA